MADRQPRFVLSRPANVKLCNLIVAHCEKKGEYAEYAEGWDDMKILAEANKDIEVGINIGHVTRARIDMVGNLAPKHNLITSPKIDKILEENATLTKRVGDLETQLIRAMLQIGNLEKWAQGQRTAVPFHPIKEIAPSPSGRVL